MVKISVIMPVYNSEKYLEKAINSVLTQSLKEIELLLVDDGSTDKSGIICDKYADKDRRVRVFHEKNSGQCAARNKMLQMCSGKYIAFIDNDDEYYPDILERCFEIAEDESADIVKYGFKVREEDKHYIDIRNRHVNEKLVVNKDEKEKKYVAVKNSGYFSSVWNGVYRKEFILKNHLQFDEKIRYGFEDCIFNIACYMKAEKQILIPQIGYYYIQRYNHSTFKKFHENKLMAWNEMVNKEYELYRMLYREESMNAHWNERVTIHLLDVLYMISLPNCDWGIGKKKEFLQDLSEQDSFSKKYLKNSKQKISKKISVFLFEKRLYISLLFISRIYTQIIVLRKSRKKMGEHN